MIDVTSKVFGYSPDLASLISVASSLIVVVIVFLIGELIDPGGISGLAGALIFSLIPVFAVYGVGTYAEPVSDLFVVTCLLLCLYLLNPSTSSSRSEFLFNWASLTLTAILAIVVKRENLIIVPVVVFVHIVFGLDRKSRDTSKKTRYLAAFLTTVVCAGFALNRLGLLAVIRKEQVEYSQFPFNVHVWSTMFPLFVKEYLSLSWYFGTVALVLISALVSVKSREKGLCPLALFGCYLVLYSSHVRSYYQAHGGTVTDLETIRYSMNLAGLWAAMAGLGISTLANGFAWLNRLTKTRLWANAIVWACIAAYGLGSWFVTDRFKEDMIANETANRLQPAEVALDSIRRNGNPDTFLISVEPLVIQMLARDPVNVIDFKDFNADLFRRLRGENPDATFFYVEQDIHKSAADRERYQNSFDALDQFSKNLVVQGNGYAIFEIL